MNHITQASTIARLLHHGQKYGDRDYYEAHVVAVVRRVEQARGATYGEVTVAYLHDVLEDTPATAEDLVALGIDPLLVRSVETVSRRESETYMEFIRRIADSGDPWAIRVKLADLWVNLNNDPGSGLADRYRRATRILERAL